MIEMSNVAHVRQRISDIEHRFNVHKRPTNRQKKPEASFADILRVEADKQKITTAATAPGAAVNNQPNMATANGQQFNHVSGLPVNDPSLAGMINEAAAKYKIDSRLLSAVAEVESHGNQEAISSAGAVGVMQLMPDTADALGVNPYDMRQNVEGGAKYLRGLLDTFNGDVEKAVAAYNAGPQAVKKYGGVPPYRETQDYVSQVLDIYR